MVQKIKQLVHTAISAIFIVFSFYFCLPITTSAATTLQQRSLSLGSAKASDVTTHQFDFNFFVPQTVGSIKFEYCDDPIAEIACVAPPGLDVSTATLTSQTGQTGFTLLASNASQIIISRPPAATDTNPNSYLFSGAINPSNLGSFYVRISTYSTVDATGPANARSSVVGAISVPISVSSEVPQILYFCSAISIPTDCSDASGDFIDLGTLVTTDTRYGTSQFLVGTNAPNGYNVTANGPTLVSGSNLITALSPPTISKAGFSQFGINLRANLNPLLGADTVGGIGGAVAANYNIQDKYYYHDGDIVASGPGPTTIQFYTVSYIVNVSSALPVGIYNTTITYVCTAGF